jgi:hypothetical protein
MFYYYLTRACSNWPIIALGRVIVKTLKIGSKHWDKLRPISWVSRTGYVTCSPKKWSPPSYEWATNVILHYGRCVDFLINTWLCSFFKLWERNHIYALFSVVQDQRPIGSLLLCGTAPAGSRSHAMGDIKIGSHFSQFSSHKKSSEYGLSWTYSQVHQRRPVSSDIRAILALKWKHPNTVLKLVLQST